MFRLLRQTNLGCFHKWIVLLCSKMYDLFWITLHIVSTLHYCKISHTLAGLMSLPHTCWLLFALKRPMDIWADGHISLKLDTTRGNSDVYKTVTKWMKEKGRTLGATLKTAVHKRYETTLPLTTSNLLTPVARQNRAETTSCRWSQLGCHVLHQSTERCSHTNVQIS